MIQFKNDTLSSQTLHTSENDTYIYKDATVKIITVFTDNGKSTALVEDENGEVFEVSRDALR
ncbi:hypothetical protein KKG72_05095 [bacterium]|nr:hypothetical protein [bacterium]MBU1995427.1 hypothetical protein [bacterium]